MTRSSTALLPLPIIPEPLLRQHQVYEPHDTRFRAAARLLQSLWRKAQALEPGFHRTRRNGRRMLGSRLTLEDAARGRNFLSPAIAQLARHELAYRERGALIEPGRLMSNLLASQTLAFNLFGPMRLDHVRAADILRRLLPDVPIATVTGVLFEHSPGRNDATFTGDRTAFDIAFIYQRSDGKRGLLAVELKYAEGLGDVTPTNLAHFDDLAHASGLFKEPAHAHLRVGGLAQLFREHLLAQATLINEAYDEAHFIVIAPRHNHLIERAASLYAAHLNPPLGGTVPFRFIELEAVIDAYGRSGDLDYAFALHDRYTRWERVDAAVEEALTAPVDQWTLTPPLEPKRLLQLG